MQQQISIRVLPEEAANDGIILRYLSKALAKPLTSITGFYPLRHSIDARGKIIWINLLIQVFVDEPPLPRPATLFRFKDVSAAKHRVIIIGAGPAGLFAALKCLELGIKPIILERGKDVRARRRDLAAINKQGEINPESNYCFGEGGAGTYSDGKLYTRSSKRGDVRRILDLLAWFGADESILYHTHPHIGTNKLPQIITKIREHIIACGGAVHFETKVTDLTIVNNRLASVTTNAGKVEGDAVILATGHSARDIFELLHSKGLHIEAKPFALGVRIEHPQALIDQCQYHLPAQSDGHIHKQVRSEYLPPASYSLVQQVEGRGVFSFCMCPGGIIAPAATNAGEIVVNGWSPSKRNNPFANSGMVVEVKGSDLDGVSKYPDFEKVTGVNTIALQSPLGMMYLQQYVERKAFEAGGGKLVAPAGRVDDFINRKISASLPACSYLPGIFPADLFGVLPSFVAQALKGGLIAFGQKMKGYRTNEAVLVATESRTSSPVRIPRDSEKLHHPQVVNLYPCAEGAGYAGGIVSAAMDGEKVVAAIGNLLNLDAAITQY